MVRLGALVTIALLGGCGRLQFDEIGDAKSMGMDGVAMGDVPTGDGAPLGIRVGAHSVVSSAALTSVLQSPALSFTAHSTILVVLWGSSNTFSATANDSIASSYTRSAAFSAQSSFATQTIWIKEDHPGGSVAVTAQWPSQDQGTVLFVIEVVDARLSGAVDAGDVAEDVSGPAFVSPTISTQFANELLIAIDLSNSNGSDTISFDNEIVVDAQNDPMPWNGAIGTRIIPLPSAYQVTARQTTGSSALVSIMSFVGS